MPNDTAAGADEDEHLISVLPIFTRKLTEFR